MHMPQDLVLLSLNTNLMIALSPQQIMLSSLAAEFSLILPSPGTPLISYFPERDALTNVIPIAVSESPLLAPNTLPVWFSGIPFARGNNPFIVPILNTPEESFAADSDSSTDTLADATEKGGEGLWVGSQLGVVSGFQALSGACVTWVGGVDLFTDKYANKEISKYVYASPSFYCMILILSKGREIWKHTVRTQCRSLDFPRIFGATHRRCRPSYREYRIRQFLKSNIPSTIP